MAKVSIESAGKKPVSVEVRIEYSDGSSEARHEHDDRIVIEATDLPLLSINGGVFGDVRTGGDLSCGDIDGDAKAGGDISCEDINGDARAGVDINCQDIHGNAGAGADLHCNEIAGNAKAGADLECSYIAGSASAGGEIASMGFEEDEEI
jgi:hypothetical protein